MPGALALAFLRSPVPCGRITELDLDGACEGPGVVGVFTAADLGETGALSVNPVLPRNGETPFPLLAAETVTAVGEPVAAVLAETAPQAQDAADAILLDIDEDAAPPLDHLAAAQSWTDGDAEAGFARAAQVVEVEITHPRLAPTPLEPRGIAVAPDGQGGATVWLSTQTPHRARTELAGILGLDPEALRVIAPDVGGAFGMKASLYPEEVCAVWAALKLGRPVRWIASRSEDFLSATHGRGLRSKGALALDAEGRFLALKARIEAPLGSWLPNSALIPAWNAGRILPGPYVMDALDIETGAQRANLPPVGIYRGAGRPEACALMERLADKAARACGLDPVELRRRNLRPADAMPHRSATGCRLDSGDYPETLALLADKAGYRTLCAERDAARRAGRLFGIGLGFYVEPSGTGWESARVTLDGRGAVVATGGSSQGHGRETALAQVAAEALNLAPERVRVLHGDTAACPAGIGALASRSTPIGASAVLACCAEINERRAEGAALPLTAEIRYEAPNEAWGHGCYLAVLEIDRDTGRPRVHRMMCLDDAGRLINPMLAHGQVTGGCAQGYGEAMMEALHFEDGQLLSGSLMDYAVPRAADTPPLSIHTTQTPTDANLLGAKGLGEAGTIGAPAALLNAAIDALSPLGVEDLQMPLTSLSLWQAIRSASERTE
ncbi:carbon monoxide dehydrogenase [Cribrihabitans marinus]|nr:carbon monoxide dehydrogenase [Cribrihabitans marinus]